MSKKIYTRTGDDGSTSLFSGGRLLKDHVRVEAYGTVDELIAVLGIAKTFTGERLGNIIHNIQKQLSNVAAELAIDQDAGLGHLSRITRVTDEDVRELERITDELSKELPPLSEFVIPGNSQSSAFLHQARTVCRRAERRVVTVSQVCRISKTIIKYMNRLSDLLFVMSRYADLRR